jgi:hypothetical protein
MSSNGLERLLHQGKKLLATTLASATLLLPAISRAGDTPLRIPVHNNSWAAWQEVESPGHNPTETLGASSYLLAKDKSLSNVYFNGSLTKEGILEFSYFTTDIRNPSSTAPIPSPKDTKIYLLCPEGTTFSQLPQRIYGFVAEKFRNDVIATPREEASGLWIKLGAKTIDHLTANDPTGEFAAKYTAGIISKSLSQMIIDNDNSENVTIGNNIRAQIGQQAYGIIQLSMEVNDNLNAIQMNEKGRTLRVQLQTPGAQRNLPVAVLFRIMINNRANTERGTVQTYTDFLQIPATHTENATTKTQPWPTGIWIHNDEGSRPENLIIKTPEELNAQGFYNAGMYIDEQNQVYQLYRLKDFKSQIEITGEGKAVIYYTDSSRKRSNITTTPMLKKQGDKTIKLTVTGNSGTKEHTFTKP